MPLLVLGTAAHATGLTNEILEPDGALYAAIAKRMALSGDFINLYGDGSDWLDKPHFPFWITALSFKTFGINAFAYKLPALLFWAMGAYYTGRFAAAVYGQTCARLAVLLYVFALHLLLSGFDVRAEPYLTGLIAAAVYHLYRLQAGSSIRHLLAGALFCACAVMTKGIFVLITISSGFVVHWIVRREWRQFTRRAWWVLAALVLLFITPELYALYHQFDRHPEKWVFGRQGVSGIRFFFWDSQFGRFFNTGPIRGSGDPFFYLHTLLWAFLPWALLLYAALAGAVRKAFTSRAALPEYITAGASLVTLLLFSLSKFQLPHYVIILFPFFAILTARMICTAAGRAARRMMLVQYITAALILIAVVALAVLFRPPQPWLLGGLVLVAGALFFTGKRSLAHAAGWCCTVMALVAVFLNLFFYPVVLRFQAGMVAGKWLHAQAYPQQPLMFGYRSYSLEFYARGGAERASLAQLQQAADSSGNALVFAPADSMNLLRQQFAVRELRQFVHFPVSRLDAGFVNAATRQQHLQVFVLALVSRGAGRP